MDGLLGLQILDMMGDKVKGVNKTQKSESTDVNSEEVKGKK
jgi:hypothetical protein